MQGSNGEAQHLSHDERSLTIRSARETLNENGFENVLVIAGTGGQSTKETKKLCADAKAAGASHALVLTPGVWPPQMTKERILKFHRDVSKHANMLRPRISDETCRWQTLRPSRRWSTTSPS